MDRVQIRNSLLFALGLGVCVAVARAPAWSQQWMRYGTYYTVVVVFGAWLIRWTTWARHRWGSPAIALRANGPEIALAIAAVGLVFATHDWQFKVLADEANMVGVARSFASDWRFDFPGSGKFYYGSPHFSHYVFDKRPPLFMFALSLLDSLTGYRLRNIWYLNGALLGATIVVAAGALRRRLGRPWNLLAVVWAIANPIVLQTASAAGVEPMLAFVWAIAGMLLLEVLEDASSPSVELLLATIVLLALARLEAGPAAAALMIAVLAFSPDRKRIFTRWRDDWLVWASPLIALPLIIQRASRSYFQGSKLPPFGFRYVVQNVSNWKRVFLDEVRFYPFNSWITVGEILALVVLVVLVLAGRTKMSRAERAGFLIFAALTGSFVVLYTTYYWGQPTKPTSARFYALPFFFAGLVVPAVLRRISALRARPLVATMLVALLFLQAVPTAYNRAFVNTMGWRGEHLAAMEFLAPRIQGRNVLLVTARPGPFLAYDLGAVSFSAFKHGRKLFAEEIERNLYDEVLFEQEITAVGGKPKPTKDTTLEADIPIELLYERPSTPSMIIRFSRLVREPGKPALPVSQGAKDAPEPPEPEAPTAEPEQPEPMPEDVPQ